MHNNNEQPLRGGASTTEGSPASLALAERLSKRGAVPASPAKRARQQQDDRGNSGDHQSAPPPGKRQRKRRVNRENGGASVLSQPAARHTGSTHNNKSLEGGDEAQAASRALFRQVLALRNNCLAALSQEDQLRIEIGSILSQARREAYLANPLFYITHKLLHSIKHHFSAEELTKIDLANVLSQAKLRASIEPLSFAPSFCWPSISNEHHMQAKQDTAYLKAREEWKLVSPEGVPKLPLEAALCSTEQAPTQLPDDTLIPEEIMTSKEEALRLQRLKVLNEMPMQKPKQYKRPPVIPERKKVKERREPKKEKLVDTVERKQMKGESNEGMNDKKRREFKTKAPQVEDTSMHWCFMQPLPVLPDPTSNVDLELLIPIGTIFMSRRELMVSGLHRPMQAGIWGGEYGAVSVVLSGGYSDVDWGHTIVYTGSGGFEPNSRVQTKDQEFTRANAG
ncbi:HNH endonuclease, variant 2 [Balamuthia mandrillaris]